MTALRVTHAARPPTDTAEALVRFRFESQETGTAVGAVEFAGGVSIACPRLAGPADGEAWFAAAGFAGDEPLHAGGKHAGGEFALIAIEVDEAACGGIERASAEAYRRLLAQVRPSAHPYLLRIWNYLGDINAGVGDAERYRRFCVGRAAAVDARFNAPPPAATAIGTPRPTGTVQVIALCTREPGLALENPRQTPAWQYPREYGPVSPGFSRGALIGAGAELRLLASGTASIVGHVSQHPNAAAAQLRESLANLEVLLHEGERRSGRSFTLDRHDALRVYLREPGDLAAVQAALGERLALDRVLFLQGDICRRELLVELEGVFAAA